MLTQACNTNTWEAEEEGLQVCGQLRLHGEGKKTWGRKKERNSKREKGKIT
jgi:hypothetical protein